MALLLVLCYVVIFYSQLGSRIPALAPLRVELLVGAAAVVVSLLRRPSTAGAAAANGLVLAILAFFATLLMSMPLSFWPTRSLETLIRIAKYFAIFIMVVRVIDEPWKLRAFLWTYVAMVALIVAEPFLGVFLGSAEFETKQGYPKLLGVTGLWKHYNSLGGFAAANLPFLYYLGSAERSVLRRVVLLAVAICSLGAVVYTGSRTAYLGVGFVFAGIIWHSQRRAKALAGALLAAATVWLLMPAHYQAQLLTLGQVGAVVSEELEPGADSMVTRWEIVKDAWSIFLDHPIVGVGVDAFPTARGRKFDRWQDTHNLYLQVLTNAGIPGAAAFGALVFLMLGTLRRARIALDASGDPDAHWLKQVSLAVTVFLLARLGVGLFGMDLYENYWWLAAGLAFALTRFASKTAGSPKAVTPDDGRCSGHLFPPLGHSSTRAATPAP